MGVIDHKNGLLVSAGYDEDDSNLPSSYVCNTLRITALARTAYVSDTGTALRAVMLVSRMRQLPSLLYSYDHTVDAGYKAVLDIDAVTARLMAEFKCLDVTQLFLLVLLLIAE